MSIEPLIERFGSLRERSTEESDPSSDARVVRAKSAVSASTVLVGRWGMAKGEEQRSAGDGAAQAAVASVTRGDRARAVCLSTRAAASCPLGLSSLDYLTRAPAESDRVITFPLQSYAHFAYARASCTDLGSISVAVDSTHLQFSTAYDQPAFLFRTGQAGWI